MVVSSLSIFWLWRLLSILACWRIAASRLLFSVDDDVLAGMSGTGMKQVATDKRRSLDLGVISRDAQGIGKGDVDVETRRASWKGIRGCGDDAYEVIQVMHSGSPRQLCRQSSGGRQTTSCSRMVG